MIIECFLYKVNSKVVFQNGEEGYIPSFVYAKSEAKAHAMAKEWLESGKSGWKVKEVLFQHSLMSSRFLAEYGSSLISFKEQFECYPGEWKSENGIK